MLAKLEYITDVYGLGVYAIGVRISNENLTYVGVNIEWEDYKLRCAS